MDNSIAPSRPQRSVKQRVIRFAKDRVKTTQAAITQATAAVFIAVNGNISINPSINAARQAKRDTMRLKAQQTQLLKMEWEQEKQDIVNFHQMSNAQQQKYRKIQRTLSSHQSRSKAQKEQLQRYQKRQAIDQESSFKSAVYRDHQQALREQEQKRRRQSETIRARIRDNHKDGEEQIKLWQQQDEQRLLEERQETFRAAVKVKEEHAVSRRKSFAFRNGDARRIRQVHARLEAERLAKESASIQLALKAKQDVDGEPKRMEDERRQSLANRNTHARMQRIEENQRQSEFLTAEHASFELKWAGEKDAEENKRQLEEERRLSLAERNAHARNVRQFEVQESSEKLASEHKSYELKWAGEKDAEEYKRQMEKERRDSLAKRNAHARKVRQFAAQESSEKLASEHTSYELKRAAEKDVEEYNRQMEKERRDSLAFRNQEARRQRVVARELYEKSLAAEVESLQLQALTTRDANEYLKQQEDQRRESLRGRNAYAHLQRQEEQQRQSQIASMEHERYELKWAAEKDADEYKRKMEKERRDSLAWRNQDASRRAQLVKELEGLRQEEERESIVLKWAGENDAKEYLAGMEEERRKSLQLRGKQFQHHQQVEKEARDAELQQQAVDEEWKAGDQSDVVEYRRKCAARDRASLLYRRKEAHVQRIEEVEERMREQLREHENFELETQARLDVANYVQTCKQRRRMSLAYRAKEHRRHFQWREQQAEQEREARSREVRARMADQRSAELARKEEQAQRALAAIQKCGSSSNAFSGIL